MAALNAMKITMIFLCVYAVWGGVWATQLGFTKNLGLGLSVFVLAILAHAFAVLFVTMVKNDSAVDGRSDKGGKRAAQDKKDTV